MHPTRSRGKKMNTIKVDNKQIAKALFFKFYHSKENRDKEALKLASALLQCNSITLNLGDIDYTIETEFEKFGCKLLIGHNGNTATFNLNGKTEIEPEKWQKMCNEIYNQTNKN